MTLDELCTQAQKLTREHFCSTINGAVGTIFEDVSTVELLQWLSSECHCEGAVRYYLQEQITAAVINKIKYEQGVYR